MHQKIMIMKALENIVMFLQGIRQQLHIAELRASLLKFHSSEPVWFNAFVCVCYTNTNRHTYINI